MKHINKRKIRRPVNKQRIAAITVAHWQRGHQPSWFRVRLKTVEGLCKDLAQFRDVRDAAQYAIKLKGRYNGTDELHVNSIVVTLDRFSRQGMPRLNG